MNIPISEEYHKEFQRLQKEVYTLTRLLKRRDSEIKGMEKYIRQLQKEIKRYGKSKSNLCDTD